MIVLDTSVVLAFMNRGDAAHEAVRDWMSGVDEELVTTPLTLAEMDHLVARYGGGSATRALREDLERGAYRVEWWPGALGVALRVAESHPALGLGLVDASLVALAAEAGTAHIATLDERHFRRVRRPLTDDEAFTLLPADAV